jgi:hypothetical protein
MVPSSGGTAQRPIRAGPVGSPRPWSGGCSAEGDGWGCGGARIGEKGHAMPPTWCSWRARPDPSLHRKEPARPQKSILDRQLIARAVACEESEFDFEFCLHICMLRVCANLIHSSGAAQGVPEAPGPLLSA